MYNSQVIALIISFARFPQPFSSGATTQAITFVILTQVRTTVVLMCSHSGIPSEIGNQFNFAGMCDRCNDFRIYEPIGRSLDNQVSQPERPMFKLLKRLMHRPQEVSCDLAEEQDFGMDTRGRDGQLGRNQLNQNRPRGFLRQPNRTTSASILCCLCHRGSEDSLRTDSERSRSPPELRREYEDRIEQLSDNISRRLDFSMTPSPSHSRKEHSKISFHREEDISEGMPAEILYSTDSGSSSRQTSDTEFLDAREYFSHSDSENDSHEGSTLSRNASILKRCRCMTCASMMHELGFPINYRIAEVCDAESRKKTRVRVNSDVQVAKYDIRSGKVMEEWVEEVNLSEEVIPIGYLKNTDMNEDADVRRSRARRKLKSLFGADKRIREADFDDFNNGESLGNDDTEEFSPFDRLSNVDGWEPRTTRNPGMR